MMLSTIMVLVEELIMGVTVRPAAGLMSNTPVKASSKVSICPIATSSLLKARRFNVSTVGVVRWPAPEA